MRRRLRNAANLLAYRLMLLAAFCWRRLMFRTTFIAITGSVGKTTTKNLLASILGNMPAKTLSTGHSSNGTKHIARYLLQVRPWHRFVVLEAGTDAPGWIRRSAWLIGPDVAIILSVARTHTNNFHTLEETAKEKASMLSGLRRDGVAILNADDSRVAAMAEKCPGRVVMFGRTPEAKVRATSISAQFPERLSLSITAQGETERVNTQLVGEHWAPSVLAAVSAALECGMSLRQAAELASRVPASTGRMEAFTLPNGATIIRDDYNGSLETFMPAFEMLKNAQAKRKILVITTVSDSTESWTRRNMRIAAEAAGVVDILVLVGEKRDTRKPGKTAVGNGLPSENLHEIPDLRDVADFLRSTLRSGDLVLLRGRTTDHITRVFHAQIQDVACWKKYCPQRILCDHCPELLGQGSLSESKNRREAQCAEPVVSPLRILPGNPDPMH